ncbi:MAG: cbb3-type cytochrome c oxidase N-terminal domain-containing protein [Candidatus Krumholzibacteriia bacterium]|nr:c-type cytochrome [bacterium]MCB9513065.1 c-type cytochrome [Candidatus Latescibacterota bacterium]MCB9516275.1 c-type cytochrome [Candidatus Latescibacterota bacterium]
MSEYKQDQVFDHDFDGIQEYDNRLPNWWLWILWGSIIFSVGYWLFFHTFGVGKLPQARYDVEMQKAAEAQLAKGGAIDDAALTLMSTLPARVDEGKQLFATYCVACHADRGQGLVGPNLTDEYWIHGARPTDIYNTVTNGVLDKGMAAWGRQLGPNRVQSLVAFVLTIKNTNVPGKAPQGEKVTE